MQNQAPYDGMRGVYRSSQELPPSPGYRRQYSAIWLGLFVIMIVIGILVNLTWFDQSMLKSHTSHLTVVQLEKRCGIRVNMIGVTDNGLVNLHFEVIDAEKARRLFQDSRKIPILTVMGSGLQLRAAPEVVEDLELQEGSVTYIAYKNISELVKPGTLVTVVIGNYMLEPIEAK